MCRLKRFRRGQQGEKGLAPWACVATGRVSEWGSGHTGWGVKGEFTARKYGPIQAASGLKGNMTTNQAGPRFKENKPRANGVAPAGSSGHGNAGPMLTNP